VIVTIERASQTITRSERLLARRLLPDHRITDGLHGDGGEGADETIFIKPRILTVKGVEYEVQRSTADLEKWDT
jgi:hypothetical protein